MAHHDAAFSVELDVVRVRVADPEVSARLESNTPPVKSKPLPELDPWL
jgi:hypothetical protein